MNLFKDCLRRFCKEKSYEYDQFQSDLYQYATFIYGGDLYENERIDSFLSIVNSMFWMSYRYFHSPFQSVDREDFQSLSSQDPHTSDYGWGCTLRSTQMILAEVFFGSIPRAYTNRLSRESILARSGPGTGSKRSTHSQKEKNESCATISQY